jgi:hypothetical protein
MLEKRDDKIHKAAELLFEHEEAREAWALLKIGGRGGMEEAAELLGMQAEHKKYKDAFLEFVSRKQSLHAVRLQEMVKQHYCDLLEERFGKKPA